VVVVDLTITLTPQQLDAIADRVAALLADRQPPDRRYLTAEQAADYIATSRERIYDLVETGKLTPRRDGRRLLFRRADLDRYLDGAS
jgi:excisionase family DNA binding protein